VKKGGEEIMDDVLKKFAFEAEKSFSSRLDFHDESPLHKVSLDVLSYLDRFKIGPAVLSLLVAFAFPEKSREKIWQEIKQVIQENRKA